MSADRINRRSILAAAGAAAGTVAIGGRLMSAQEQKKEYPQPKSKTKDGEKREGVEVDLDEVTREIQIAIDAAVRDQAQIDFLHFLEVTLPDQVLLNSQVPVWRQFVELAVTRQECRTVELGSSPLPNQSRGHRHGALDYRYETRTARTVAFADFCHPEIEDIWNDVRNCAIGAATVAVITAIIAESPDAGYEIFYPAFYVCLSAAIGNRAREVEVSLRSETEHSCWTNHC